LQRAVGIAPQRHETLGELVTDMARRADLRSEVPVSERPTRHEVKVNGQSLHINCFADTLSLPFVRQDATFEVRSESPLGGEVRAIVTNDGVKVTPPDAVMSIGATWAGTGPVQAMACPYINAFPSRADYQRWAAATPRPLPSPCRWRMRSPSSATWYPMEPRGLRGGPAAVEGQGPAVATRPEI
jgi:hypothetical protein